MDNIIILAPDCPYPPNHGGKLDIYNRMLGYKKKGKKIHLLFFCKEKPLEFELKHLNEICEYVYYEVRNQNINNFFSLKPYQVISRVNSRFEKKLFQVIDKLKDKNSNPYIIYEGDFVAQYCEKVKQKYPGIANILRVHNIESIYFRELFNAEKNIIKKVYYFTEILKFKWFEKKIYNKFDALFFISVDEMKRVNHLYKFWFPPATTLFNKENKSNNSLKNTLYKETENKYVFLFVGHLGLATNINGLLWFVNNVFLPLNKKYSHLMLWVVGRDPSERVKKLNKLNSVHVFPNVQSVDEFYQKCNMVVVPILSGAGVKLKLIEALCKKKPVLATAKAIEGTGLTKEHLLYGNSKDELIEICEKAINNQIEYDPTKSYDFILKNYDVYKNIVRSEKIIKESLEGWY